MTGYTAEQLLSDAEHILGRRPSYSWLRTLIRDGHLSHPANRGIGGGGRLRGTWSPSQRQLFLTEVQSIAHGLPRADLCNLPVAWWLYVDGETPTEQAKRALRTWAHGRHKTSKRLARQAAAGLADRFAGNPGFVLDRRSRDAFVREVADTGNGKMLDTRRLVKLTDTVMNPDGQRGSVGPEGASLTPESLARQIGLMRAGIAALNRASDKKLEDLREHHLDTIDELGR